MKKIFFLLILSTIFLTKTVSIYAQSALGLSAIPPRLEISVNPGQVVTREIKIRNESSTERVLVTTVKDFIVTDEKGTPIQLTNVDESQNRWAASNWVQISPTQTRLKPGETKALILTVLAPNNATPGGHYAMVLHTPQNGVVLNESGSTVQTNIGTLVYITVSGPVKENAVVKEFTAPNFSEFGPINFQTTITNLSDVHITPAGSITITNWFGGRTSRLGISNTNIFPYTSRNFTNTLEKKILFGRYKAHFEAAYGTTGQVISATLFFWVIPWRFILVSSLIISLIIALIYLIQLNKKQKPPKENEQVEELEKEIEDLKNKYRDRK